MQNNLVTSPKKNKKMSSITEAVKAIKKSIPDNVTLIAVSKTHTADAVKEAYDTGQRDFGENKVQEMTEKAAELPHDIRWHMIGHLQTNKVKYIAPFVHMIHSVDSERLLRTIDKEAAKIGRTIPCLLQVHIAQEETKFGLTEQELTDLLNSAQQNQLKNVKICGLMGMATNTDDETQIANEFSMGMSDDYPIAIANGATMIRVGNSIFGQRIYTTQKEQTPNAI